LKKNGIGIYCDCFQTFVERENFFEKDAGKLLAKMLLRVSNVCNSYRDLTKIEDSDKLKATGEIMSGKEGKKNLTFALYPVKIESENREVLAREFVNTT